MADLKKAQVCNEGNLEYGRFRCNRGEYNKQSFAYPNLPSVVYRARDYVYGFNRLVGGKEAVVTPQ